MSAERAHRNLPRLLYSQAEAAEMLGISGPELIREAIARRTPVVQIGSRRKFLLSDINWLRRQMEGCVSYGEEFGPPPPPFNAYFRKGDAGRLLSRSRSGAKMRGKSCSLTLDDVQAMIDRSAGFCEVSGIPFSNESLAGKTPWSASMDRIDARVGYTAANCRLVCYAVNLALNEWGDAVLIAIARGVLRNEQSPL